MTNDINLSRLHDQFYTKPETALDCIAYLKQHIQLDSFLWIEPSAGQGAFVHALETSGLADNCLLSIDIDPKYPGVQKQDFLKRNNRDLYKRKNIICIGNPPFGKNSSLAIKFFNHAALFSQYVAMIFPATFEKTSVQNRLHKNMHLIASFKLPSCSFIFEGKDTSVPTVFQIWEKRETMRETVSSRLTHDLFDFVSSSDADFAIQRVGNAAGKIKNDTNVSTTAHYFIKVKEPWVKDIFTEIDWKTVKYNTAGNPSIAKPELILLFNKIVEQKGNNNE